jgi:pimeloyl-ACP methyl ester carboxylesterase
MSVTLPAILLHGQPGGPGDWKWVIEALAGRVEVTALRRPGYDGTRAGGVRHSALAVIAALDAAGTERAVMVGHSYGGAVAAWLAAFHPDRVAGLVLVSAAANRASLVPGDRLLAAPYLGPLASAGLLWGTGVATQLPLLRRRIAWAAQLPPEYLVAEGRRSLRLATLRTFLTEQRLLLAELPLLEDRLATISTPTRVLVGSHDTFVPPSAGRALATQIPAAELIEVPRGGHVLNVQHPETVAEAIIRAATSEPVISRSPARPPDA